jgi:hypothetical protein
MTPIVKSGFAKMIDPVMNKLWKTFMRTGYRRFVRHRGIGKLRRMRISRRK